MFSEISGVMIFWFCAFVGLELGSCRVYRFVSRRTSRAAQEEHYSCFELNDDPDATTLPVQFSGIPGRALTRSIRFTVEHYSHGQWLPTRSECLVSVLLRYSRRTYFSSLSRPVRTPAVGTPDGATTTFRNMEHQLSSRK